MKIVILTLTGLFLFLFVVTTFVPYEPAKDAAIAAGFTSDDIDTGLQFAFERRLFMWAGIALELGLLSLFALTALSRRLADRWLLYFRGYRILAAVGVGLSYWIFHAIVYLPLGIARLEHSRAWGMTELDIAGWLRDYALGTGIQIVCEAIIVAGFYALLICLPRTWWLLAPIGAGILAFAFALLSPILISPLFNEFTPLSETEWKSQEPNVRKLMNDAEIPVQEILVMNASKQSKHTNAYFTGLGPTRRIVLYDNLLKNHANPEEIKSVLGHEIGHWKYDHINQGILLGMLGALVGCCVLHRTLSLAVGRSPWQMQSIADPTGLPLVMLLVYLGSFFVAPVGNVVSRHFERQADQTSLELADVPQAFIDAERNLARVNKGNVAPTPWNVWLFSTHPPTVERIRMAEEWKQSSTKDTKGTKEQRQ